MRSFFGKNVATATALVFSVMAGGCARDLSNATYTSNDTLSLTLEGVVKSARPVKIKNADRLSENGTGMLAGGAFGGIAGAGVGKGTGQAAAAVGGAVAGAALGALAESRLGQQDGFEYIIKLDTSGLKSDYYEGTGAMCNAISAATTNGLVTVVQGADVVLPKGRKVYVVFSDKRVRVIDAE
ncbi:MAG: hypothetical protein ABW189_09065 [Rickettsiales bacterium]